MNKKDAGVTASAPGSLMLMGEHAVLHGQPALCAAIDQQIVVSLTPNKSNDINIHSSLGTYSCGISAIESCKPFEFVLTAIQQFEHLLENGFDLDIEADFTADIGFGSSSAVTVATLGAVSQFLAAPTDAMSIFKLARTVIQAVQGRGSGADVAASTFGGVVFYQMQPLVIEALETELKIQPIYSGAKRPTAEIIDLVNQQHTQKPEQTDVLFEHIGDCVHRAKAALLANDIQAFYQQVQLNRNDMRKLGLENAAIATIFTGLKEQPAKISGSGLGDCIIAFGNTDQFPQNSEQKALGIRNIDANIARSGLTIKVLP